VGIAVDTAGNAYVTGRTQSPDFPTVNPLQPTYGGGDSDAFVTKVNPSGSALVYSTFLGGSNEEFGFGIAVDTAGNAYVTGATLSPDFPTVNPLQPTLGGGFDAFVTKLNPSGTALVYSTFLGGRDLDRGNGIAVDSAGNAYVTGETSSPNFPTVNPLQPTFGGGFADAFVAKIAEACVLNISDVSASPSQLWPPDHRLVNVTVNYDVEATCEPATCTLSVSSNEPQNGTGDGDTSADWEVIDEHHVRLRAERADGGAGRIYTITITCTDTAGNSSSKSVQVAVPHDQS
jgi:hypothetical protein